MQKKRATRFDRSGKLRDGQHSHRVIRSQFRFPGGTGGSLATGRPPPRWFSLNANTNTRAHTHGCTHLGELSLRLLHQHLHHQPPNSHHPIVVGYYRVYLCVCLRACVLKSANSYEAALPALGRGVLASQTGYALIPESSPRLHQPPSSPRHLLPKGPTGTGDDAVTRCCAT